MRSRSGHDIRKNKSRGELIKLSPILLFYGPYQCPYASRPSPLKSKIPSDTMDWRKVPSPPNEKIAQSSTVFAILQNAFMLPPVQRHLILKQHLCSKQQRIRTSPRLLRSHFTTDPRRCQCVFWIFVHFAVSKSAVFM